MDAMSACIMRTRPASSGSSSRFGGTTNEVRPHGAPDGPLVLGVLTRRGHFRPASSGP
jgi:hypothetical protein